MTFLLYGSRRTGRARADSDWDIVYVPEKRLSMPDSRFWGDVSACVMQHLGWYDEVNKLISLAREEFSIPAEDEVDLFILLSHGETPYLALLEWDDNHGCLAGWIY